MEGVWALLGVLVGSMLAVLGQWWVTRQRLLDEESQRAEERIRLLDAKPIAQLNQSLSDLSEVLALICVPVMRDTLTDEDAKTFFKCTFMARVAAVQIAEGDFPNASAIATAIDELESLVSTILGNKNEGLIADEYAAIIKSVGFLNEQASSLEKQIVSSGRNQS